MSEPKRVHLTELDPDQIQLFAHRTVDKTEPRTNPPHLTYLSTFERVQRIVENISRFKSVKQRLDALLYAFAQDTPAAQQGAIYLSTAVEHTFVIGAVFPRRPDVVGTEINAPGGYVNAVAHVKSPVLLPDVQRDAHSGYPELLAAVPAAQSALVVPFVVGGKTVGVLSLENCEQTYAFTSDDLDFAVFLSKHCAFAVENARLVAMRPQTEDWPTPELQIIQSLAQLLPLGVLIVTQDRRRVWGNPAFCNLTGFSNHELGRNLFRVHRSLTQYSANTGDSPATEPQQLILTRRDKSLCPVTAAFLGLDVLGIRYSDGYVGIFQDQSQVNALERELLHMQRLSSIGTLMSGAAHELNSPLTAIVGFAELLLARQDIPVDTCQDLKTITRQAERSIHVMRELLDYVQIESKEPAQIDVNYIIRQLVRFRMYARQPKELAIDLDLADPAPRVLGSAQQLQQVLINLINNAEQACALAGRPCKLWIHTERVKSANVQIAIRDNGPGIPEELQSHVFDPFFTTKPAEECTGLGLAVCKQITAQHKGHIWFDSDPLQGTTFYIDLPICDGWTEEKTCSLSQHSAHQCDLPARILVVDDEKSISNLLSKVLSRTGHNVDIALNGREALRKLHDNVYDVVFLDLKIPDLPGQAVHTWIKHHDVRLLQRTVVLTGDTLNAETLSFLEQEQVVHLLKPFQLVDLRNVLSRVWPGETQPVSRVGP